MSPEESRDPLKWMRYAERDVKRVQYMLNGEDPEAAGFFLQQAVEKFLKSVLVKENFHFKKTHDLEFLLNDCKRYVPELEQYREVLQDISGFYMAERYPLGLDMSLSPEDVQEALADVTPMIEAIRQYITNRI